MSTSDAGTSPAPSGPAATLPPGWMAGPARETSTTNQAGQVVQGVQIPLTSPNQSTTTVFIPYTVLAQGAAAVQAVLDARIAALNTLPGQV